MAVNYLNEIISVFLQQNVDELSDNDLDTAIGIKDRSCSTGKIRHIILTVPSLFRLQYNKDGTFLVRIEPEINICQDFLDGKCSSKTGGCNQLHICRYFGHCMKKGCHFPHDFSRGYNRQLIEKSNCQNIDPLLLVRLIRFHNGVLNRLYKSTTTFPVVPKLMNVISSSVEPKPIQRNNQIHPRQRSGDRRCHTTTCQENFVQLILAADVNSQIKISFPTISITPNVTIETIENILSHQGLSIEKRLDSKADENFHQWTLQLRENSALDTFLRTFISIAYNGSYLKFKRAIPVIDSKSFVLKSKIDAKRGPITTEKCFTYIDQLIDSGSYNLTDLSLPSEQILLIQCEKIIDFNQLCRVQKSRRQLQGSTVSLMRIYELDVAIIESALTPLSSDIVERIVESIYEMVFAVTVVSNQKALIEFTSNNALEQWLADRDMISREFDVDIKPVVEYVDENKYDSGSNTSPRSAMAHRTEQKLDNRMSQLTIRLRQSWALVVNHPRFGVEYRNYIRSQLGFEVDIQGDRIGMPGSFVSDAPGKESFPTDLNKRTNTFMHRFGFHSVVLRQPLEQLDILRAHSTTVAFCCTKGNNYLIATRKSNAQYIMNKLLSENSEIPVPPVTSAVYEAIDSTDRRKSATLLIPPPTPNSPFINKKPAISDGIYTRTVWLPVNTPAQVAFFGDETFKSYLQRYINQMYNVKLNIESEISNNSCLPVLKIIGRDSSLNETRDEILTIISSFRTKTFVEATGSDWIEISDAVHVIQHQFNQRTIVCVCQQKKTPLSILVHYIDEKYAKLGVSERRIDDLCRKDLILVTCKSMKPNNTEWGALKRNILRRSDYGKDICMFSKRQTVTLYGVPNVVKEIEQQLQLLNQNLKTINHSVVDTISNIKQLKKPPIETPYKLSNIEKAPQLGNETVHRNNNQINSNIPQTYSITFNVDEPGFEVLIQQNSNPLLDIIKSKCSLQKQILSQTISIIIPQAKVDLGDDTTFEVSSPEDDPKATETSANAANNSTENWFWKLFRPNKANSDSSQSAQQASSTTAATSISNADNTPHVIVGNSKIIVCMGDLTEQAVDIIVACSTSTLLCNAIISAAGQTVTNLYKQLTSSNTLAFETTGGSLPCKQIIFRPWNHDRNQLSSLKQSVDQFVASVITHALQHNFRTIALPSIGCGQLGHSPTLIAEYMIGETYQQLKAASHSRLVVSFVLLRSQQNVYDAFADQLTKIQSVKATPTSVSFDKQTVQITLTGSSNIELSKCQDEIKQLARSCSSKLHLTDNIDIADWCQESIEKYYKYCLQRRVIPTLDIQNHIVDLIGPKAAVTEAHHYYFQLTTETLRNARIQVLSSGYVWSVEVSSGKWNQYSFRINKLIEDAQSRNLRYIEFKNEKLEQCRLIFSSMEEHCQTRKRKVCRKPLDSSLPNTWNLFEGNFKRVVLTNSSKEYKDVCDLFDQTMKSNYAKILKIEHIQNKRWYKQYAAHRDEFTQRYGKSTERLLFHGCSSTSAEKIIQECFNRTFAGVNGVLYGCGVYFHEHAKYSSGFTRPNTSSERTMFLARVLLGQTCIGTPSTKVPPAGFDTTTDGQHIFVIYHDAAAYGEFLITYQ